MDEGIAIPGVEEAAYFAESAVSASYRQGLTRTDSGNIGLVATSVSTIQSAACALNMTSRKLPAPSPHGNMAVRCAGGEKNFGFAILDFGFGQAAYRRNPKSKIDPPKISQ